MTFSRARVGRLHVSKEKIEILRVLPDDIKEQQHYRDDEGVVEEQLTLNAATPQDNSVREDIRCCLENRQRAEPIDVGVFSKKQRIGFACQRS